MKANGRQQPKTSERLRERYRRMLRRPASSDEVVDEMREHVIRLAQTICEHVWGRRFY
jgi:hypothetical protein